MNVSKLALVAALFGASPTIAQAQLAPVLEQRIDPAVPAGSGTFGFHSISVSGSWMAIGEGFFSQNTMGPGRVHLYERIGTQWSTGTVIARADRGFGFDCELDGDTLVVGANNSEITGESAGAAYVYVRAGTTWNLQATLTGPTNEFDDFGFAVAIERDRIAVGSTRRVGSQPGRVDVFERSGNAWNLTATITGTNRRFGGTLALDGDRLVVGTRGYNQSTGGQIFIYELQSGSWDEVASFASPPGLGGSGYAWSIDSSGDRVVVGAFSDLPAPAPDGVGQGAAYVYLRTATGWIRETTLHSHDSQGVFGASVAVSGTRVAVGDAFDASATSSASGSVTLFELGEKGWTTQSTFRPDELDAAGTFGRSLTFDDERLIATSSIVPGGTGAAYEYTFTDPPYPSFCEADGGGPPGCGECPCANDGPRLVRGGCLNSTNASAWLTATGTASLADDTLVFRMIGGTRESFALLVSADLALPQQGPYPVGSGIVQAVFDGLRCVGINLQRHPTHPTGEGGEALPWSQILNSQWSVGQTRNFQVIYRELASAGCGTRQATSNAIAVTVEP